MITKLALSSQPYSPDRANSTRAHLLDENWASHVQSAAQTAKWNRYWVWVNRFPTLWLANALQTLGGALYYETQSRVYRESWDMDVTNIGGKIGSETPVYSNNWLYEFVQLYYFCDIMGVLPPKKVRDLLGKLLKHVSPQILLVCPLIGRISTVSSKSIKPIKSCTIFVESSQTFINRYLVVHCEHLSPLKIPWHTTFPWIFQQDFSWIFQSIKFDKKYAKNPWEASFFVWNAWKQNENSAKTNKWE